MAPDAVHALYLRYVGEIRHYLARRLSSTETAADLAQETFIRLLRGRPAEPIDDPRAYLYRIAANLATDHLRSSARTPPTVPDEHPDHAHDPMPGPEHTLLARDELRRLARAIDELPSRRREIFLLHKFEGLSHAEIAARLGIAKNTVMVQMMKALAHCRDRLHDED